jgi:serine O-acetyltransferase
MLQANVDFVVGDMLYKIQSVLEEQIQRALLHLCRLKKSDCTSCKEMAEQVTQHLLEQLPNIRKTLKTDIQAAFEGDPAASSYEEIVLSYPGLKAIAIHRVAHELYLKDVPLIRVL